MTIDETKILNTLSNIQNPKLDEPITKLNFISNLEIQNKVVNIQLRLPTYFCTPNFTYLIMTNTRKTILSIPNIRWTNVILDDHYASDEINDNVNESQDFNDTFPDETKNPNLGELHNIFQRKSFVSRQEKLCQTLLADNRTPTELVQIQIGDLPPTDEAEKYLKRQAKLEVDVSPKTPLIVDPDDKKIPEKTVVEHLKFAKTIKINIEDNAELCKKLLATLYSIAERKKKTT